MELDLIGCGLSLVGRLLWAYALIQVEDGVFCTNESKPLALPWERTPRLSSGVRVSTHVVKGMSEYWDECETRTSKM